MKEKIKIICLILLTISALIIAIRFWIYTVYYDRWVDKQIEFQVRNYAE